MVATIIVMVILALAFKEPAKKVKKRKVKK